MANLELVFSIEGETELIRRLQGVDKDLKDWTPEFKKIGNMLLKTFRHNFSTKGRTLGSPWAPLKPSTIAEKMRLGYPLDILVRTGLMRDSFVSKAGKYEVIVSNPIPYFVFHQSKKPRFKLPRRVMMKIDDDRKQLIVKIIQESIQDTLQAREFIN